METIVPMHLDIPCVPARLTSVHRQRLPVFAALLLLVLAVLTQTLHVHSMSVVSGWQKAAATAQMPSPASHDSGDEQTCSICNLLHFSLPHFFFLAACFILLQREVLQRQLHATPSAWPFHLFSRPPPAGL